VEADRHNQRDKTETRARVDGHTGRSPRALFVTPRARLRLAASRYDHLAARIVAETNHEHVIHKVPGGGGGVGGYGGTRRVTESIHYATEQHASEHDEVASNPATDVLGSFKPSTTIRSPNLDASLDWYRRVLIRRRGARADRRRRGGALAGAGDADCSRASSLAPECAGVEGSGSAVQVLLSATVPRLEFATRTSPRAKSLAARITILWREKELAPGGGPPRSATWTETLSTLQRPKRVPPPYA